MTLQSVALASLIEDFSIYPRHAVDTTYVNQLAEAVRAGVSLPPPVVDAGTLRIADGWHRVRCYRKVLGSDASIDVDSRSFPSYQELVRFAVDANVTHGRRLDRVDRVRCAILLQEAGLGTTQIALTLRIRESEVQRIRLRVGTAPDGGNEVIPGTDQIPLKRPAMHLAGQTLTEDQARAHGTLPGTSLTLLARQLLVAINAGFVDRENARLQAVLVELHAALGAYLAQVGSVQ